MILDPKEKPARSSKKSMSSHDETKSGLLGTVLGSFRRQVGAALGRLQSMGQTAEELAASELAQQQRERDLAREEARQRREKKEAALAAKEEQRLREEQKRQEAA